MTQHLEFRYIQDIKINTVVPLSISNSSGLFKNIKAEAGFRNNLPFIHKNDISSDDPNSVTDYAE